ncbi:MAG: carbohydrate kinase family protein [Aestuariibaculum sp.]
MPKITCFGEVLWDVFPTHRKIGGAPLNVANRLKALDNEVTMVTAIGKDKKGREIKRYLQDCGIDVNCVQAHNEYKTGKVKVMLNGKGMASYDIKYPRAWDKITLTEVNKAAVKESDAFVFGSLVARDDISKDTLYQLVELAKYKIFDLNLRIPYYTKDRLLYLMGKADFIKFNDEELYKVGKMMGSKYKALEQNLQFVAKQTNTRHVCVTKGEHGAVLLYNGNLYYNSGYLIHVVDTVGAGDSFLGVLISELLKGVAPQKAIDFACAVGALVAQNEGANPKLSLDEINTFINPDL